MILISGGAGYIGAHVNKALNILGYNTVVYDNLFYGHRKAVKWGEFVLGDLANIEQLRLLFRTYPITAVMHFAAFAYVGESVLFPQKYYANNLKNTLNLLETMLEANISKFIFSSTCATYGIPNEIPITETHHQAPINPYGQSKLMVEKVLRDFNIAYNLKYISLRYFNAAGADPDSEIGEQHALETHLIPLAFDVVAGKRENIQIFGTNYDTPDGTCIRDYVHVSDLAQAHVKALELLLAGGNCDIFNLGNEIGFSVREVIESVRRVTGRNIVATEELKRPGDPPVLIGSSVKARSILKWNPEYQDLDFIVKTAWNWYIKSQVSG